ncbi:MAG: hypothetical protein Q4G21_06500 [Dermabacter sp.]|nr:hypothetical protein [Dermabacter sp.]
MGIVVVFMIVAVALAAGLLVIVALTVAPRERPAPLSKVADRSTSRTPKASLNKRVPVQSWPLVHGGEASPNPAEDLVPDEVLAEPSEDSHADADEDPAPAAEPLKLAS